jgi:1-acyl-sn-glycerol-3-phosphate acyltransferase
LLCDFSFVAMILFKNFDKIKHNISVKKVNLDSMRGIKIIFWLVWRVWFYILMAIPIIIMFPFLVASILTDSGYPYFFKMARIWSKVILFGMGFYYKIDKGQELEENKSYMFVANHTSMVDIMLMLVTTRKPFVFVGKKELSKIPLFGLFYKRTCILVDRGCSRSRGKVFESARKRINQGLSICIFPEGKVPEDESIVLDEFKNGAFRLAIEHHLTIVPIAFLDNKKRYSYTIFSGKPGLLRVKTLPFLETNDKTKSDVNEIRDHSWKLIYKELI